MLNKFNNIYLNILNEAKYETDYWMRIATYKSIEIYIRRDRHLLNRLLERYDKSSVAFIIRIIQRFIKEENKKGEDSVFNRDLTTNPEIPYTLHGILSNVYVSGRFKANAGIWRCYISTVLPNEKTHYNKSDYFAEVKA